MSSVSIFEVTLSGGHPNSLGNTETVADTVNGDRSLLTELVATYASTDEVVRLRVSSALKRVAWEHPEWVHGELESIMDWVEKLQQPSALWSLGQMLLTLRPLLSSAEYRRAVKLMKQCVAHSTDWIVLNHTMQTLAEWALDDPELEEWLIPQLVRLSHTHWTSVSKRAERLLAKLTAQ